MSTILVVYLELPNFPATDQHPLAARFQLGSRWFDVLDGPPTQADVDAWDLRVAAHAARINSFVAETDRAEIVTLLKTGTPAQIETYVRTKLNADSVTNLATAVTFCKRTESAIVQIAKAISLIVKV